MKLADPLDLAVASAFHRTAAPAREPTTDPSRHQIARRIVAEALALGTFDPLTVEVAEIIYGFDQEAIEQSWARLSEHRRQPYYDIAEAVLAHMRTRYAVVAGGRQRDRLPPPSQIPLHKVRMQKAMARRQAERRSREPSPAVSALTGFDQLAGNQVSTKGEM